jgi:hypothetical protein
LKYLKKVVLSVFVGMVSFSACLAQADDQKMAREECMTQATKQYGNTPDNNVRCEFIEKNNAAETTQEQKRLTQVYLKKLSSKWKNYKPKLAGCDDALNVEGIPRSCTTSI